MDKISPEEKIQWMKKILQKKESISSVASKIGVYYTTVDKWLRNYKAIGATGSFFSKRSYLPNSCSKRSRCFRLPFWKKVLSGDICAPAQNCAGAQISPERTFFQKGNRKQRLLFGQEFDRYDLFEKKLPVQLLYNF